jgi:hypothetical protein
MAVPSNTFLTYSTNGQKESFEDIIYNIAPTDTPFLSSLSRESIGAKRHQWQTDSLATAANNAQLEGDDATADAATATVLADNYMQIMRKVPQVSGSNRAVAKYGRSKDELAYQLAKRGKELKRDMEFALTQNTTYNAGAAGTARQLRGLEGWIATNGNYGSGGSAPVPSSNTAPTDGTQRALTEAMLKDVLLQCFNSGGSPTICMFGAFNRQSASAFTGNATRTDESEDKKVTATVSVYVSDFGDIKLIPNRFQRARTGFVLDMDYWKLGVLRPIQQQELAKTGDSDKTQIITEVTLIAGQEAASGAIRDLTTA